MSKICLLQQLMLACHPVKSHINALLVIPCKKEMLSVVYVAIVQATLLLLKVTPNNCVIHVYSTCILM